jgi:hypothetical protein
MVKSSLAKVVLVSMVALGCVAGASAFSRKSPEPTSHGGKDAGAPASFNAGAAANQVWITRPDGAQSCSTSGGQSLDDGAAELRKSKVRVLESRKGNDGKMRAQMCGIPSGSTNSFLIPKEDLARAVAQGYVEAK